MTNILSISTKVLILGAGSVALTAARELCLLGHPVLLAGLDADFSGNPFLYGDTAPSASDPAALLEDLHANPRITFLPSHELLEFNGAPGAFRVKLGHDGAFVEDEVGAVILAGEPELKSPFEAWGLEESGQVKSLSQLLSDPTATSDHVFGDRPLKVVFFSGFTHHATPFSQEKGIRAAIRLAKNRQNRIFFITEHFKVAHTGLERLHRRAREAGVLFVKLTGALPEIVTGNGRLKVAYDDETLGDKVVLTPDLLILEEALAPAPETASIAERLEIHLDPAGFFQGDNVYNLPIYTNRVGIFVAGPARGPVSLETGIEEAKACALAVHLLLGEGKPVIPENKITLDTRKCTICLTCFRLCPHRAVSYLKRRPVFSDLACKACGICAAECPMDAIQIKAFTDDTLKAEIRTRAGEAFSGDQAFPVILAFCCHNSAYDAALMAARRGMPLPPGLKTVQVPCAGRIDPDFLLTAFNAGADGVMVLGCHPESCKSVRGNELAQWRVEGIREILVESGLEQERIHFGSLAPGSSAEFAAMAREMENTLKELGPNPIRTIAMERG